jgi:DNA-binding NtrC family response regulator
MNDVCSQGVTERLQKPLTLHQLAYAIRRALEQVPDNPESTGAADKTVQEPTKISIEVSDAVGPCG